MKKTLLAILCIALVLGSFGIAFADASKTFADMPDNWSTEALNKAVENDLLKGYVEGGKTLIKADNNLTRAEMATVVNRAFAAVKKADISKVTDVTADKWYANDMAIAVKMGTFSLDTKMRPNDKITRQEAFTVLARAFKLIGTDSKHKALAAFSDKADIATWALDSLDGMAAAGYIQGAGGKLNPKANITRAEFATVMDNIVKEYISASETVTSVVAKGNVLVRAAGTTLKNVTIKGDLIIADGVGEGDVTLDNVKVEGRTVVRGGGVNSIIIKGNSDLGKVIVSKVDGKVRISVEGGAEVDVVFVDDGSDDVLVEGTFGELEVAGDNVTVTATKATIAKAEVSGDNSKIVAATGTTIKTAAVSGKSSGITANEGATVDKVVVSGSNAKIDGKGTVKDVEVKTGGNNASITTPNTVTKVDAGVTGATAGGVAVPGGSTATNNPTGTDAKVDETPSTGGGGGSSPKPTLELSELKYNDQPVEQNDGIYQIKKSALSSGGNSQKISVTIVGSNFANKDYLMEVSVTRLSGGSPEVKTATVTGVPGSLMNKKYDQEFNKLGDLFGRFLLIASALGDANAETQLNDLKSYLDTQQAGAKYLVKFSFDGNTSVTGGEFKFEIIN